MSSHILPFLWLHGEDDETLIRGIQDIQDSGCRVLCAESRTHPDFLGPTWWHEMEVLLRACRERGMQFYLLDDTHFPSGYGNGVGAGTPFQRMMLRETHMDFTGPLEGGRILVRPDGAGGMPVAVIAGRKLRTGNRVESFVDLGGFAVRDLQDLTDRVEDGMIRWDVPEGTWRAFVLTAAYVSERNPPQTFINPRLPDASRLMIETIYAPHAAFFGAACGTTFLGFFSDEPALRAGRGSHAVLGEYPMLPVPWRMDLPDILKKSFGEDARAWLPALWYDCGEKTAEMRYALMDAVSGLYAENYSQPLGAWCQAHGLEYIGHVIEQNNAHSRLGQGAGHYFRAVSGQTMSGMDLVLHELKPSSRDHYHAWKTQDFEAEDGFFRHMLPQMTLSAALIDPKKKGRALCEIFGAYGWQEDVGEMRYLANFLLSRGINYFTPHAFSLKPFPDPDSPPHFGRENPLMPMISRLFGEMEETAGLLDGGTPVMETAVLYYAEMEWLNGSGCMKSQEIVRVLEEHQIPCMVIPSEHLDAWPWKLLLVPEAEAYPESVLSSLRRAEKEGRQILFVSGNGRQQADAGMPGPWIRLEDAAACAEAFRAVETDTPQPLLHVYPYIAGEGPVLVLFNEHDREELDFRAAWNGAEDAVLYDPESRTCVIPERTVCGGRQFMHVHLLPGQLLIAGSPRGSWPLAVPEAQSVSCASVHPLWTMTLPDGQTACSEALPDPVSISSRVCGTVVYEADVETGGFDGLEFEGASGSVRLFLDGKPAGLRDATPYRFQASMPAGKVHIRAEVTIGAVYRVRDELSMFEYLPRAGIRGEIVLYRKEEKGREEA